MENLEKVVTIFKQMKIFPDKVIVDTENGSFSFFKEKKEGGRTRAVETLKEIKPQPGDGLVVRYRVNGQYKNAVFFARPTEGDVPSTPTTRKPEFQKQNESEAMYKLAENQNKIVAKIQELEKRVEALETILANGGVKKEAFTVHQELSKPEELPTIELDETATVEDAEDIFGSKATNAF